MIESITDPLPPNGWYDNVNNEEIADICNTMIVNYTNPSDGKTWSVNPGWSDSLEMCVTSRPGLSCQSTSASGSGSGSGSASGSGSGSGSGTASAGSTSPASMMRPLVMELFLAFFVRYALQL